MKKFITFIIALVFATTVFSQEKRIVQEDFIFKTDFSFCQDLKTNERTATKEKLLVSFIYDESKQTYSVVTRDEYNKETYYMINASKGVAEYDNNDNCVIGFGLFTEPDEEGYNTSFTVVWHEEEKIYSFGIHKNNKE